MTSVERELRRVGAAFRVKEWQEKVTASTTLIFHGYDEDSHPVECWIDPGSARVEQVVVGIQTGEASCWLDGEDAEPHAGLPEFNEPLARALYCLGLGSTQIERDLGVVLSAHERLELRHRMPREFWPQRWWEEENGLGDIKSQPTK